MQTLEAVLRALDNIGFSLGCEAFKSTALHLSGRMDAREVASGWPIHLVRTPPMKRKAPAADLSALFSSMLPE